MPVSFLFTLIVCADLPVIKNWGLHFSFFFFLLKLRLYLLIDGYGLGQVILQKIQEQLKADSILAAGELNRSLSQPGEEFSFLYFYSFCSKRLMRGLSRSLTEMGKRNTSASLEKKWRASPCRGKKEQAARAHCLLNAAPTPLHPLLAALLLGQFASAACLDRVRLTKAGQVLQLTPYCLCCSHIHRNRCWVRAELKCRCFFSNFGS